MKTFCQLVFLGAILGMLSSDAFAQRGGRPGGGEGGRGGRAGGAEGGRGARGGGDAGGGRGGFGGGAGRGGAEAGGGRGGFGGGGTGRGGFGGGDAGGRGGGGTTRGGFGGPSAGMSRLDTNGDGRLDQGEIDSIPQGWKQAMESRGVRLAPGSVEEVTSSMMSQFQRSRSGEGGTGGDRGGDRDRNDSQSNKSAYSPAAPFRPRTKDRITVDLPPKYSELDMDFDGQIGLYEWITAKRESLNEFDEIDANVDGLLTPKELKFYDEITAAGEKKVVSYKRDRVMIIDGSGSFTARQSGKKTSQKSSMSPEEQKKQLETGKRYFAAMDKNKNGKVDKEEWESSQRIRPWFEKSGIKLDSMGEEDFSKNFLKAVELMKKDGGKDKGDKDRKRR